MPSIPEAPRRSRPRTGHNPELHNHSDNSSGGRISALDLLDLPALTAASDHGLLLGLGDDDHAQYLLLAGRSTGQTAYGGTAASADLTLSSTAHATKDRIFLGSAQASAYDELRNVLGIGTSVAEAGLHIRANPQTVSATLLTSADSSPLEWEGNGFANLATSDGDTSFIYQTGGLGIKASRFLLNGTISPLLTSWTVNISARATGAVASGTLTIELVRSDGQAYTSTGTVALNTWTTSYLTYTFTSWAAGAAGQTANSIKFTLDTPSTPQFRISYAEVIQSTTGAIQAVSIFDQTATAAGAFALWRNSAGVIKASVDLSGAGQFKNLLLEEPGAGTNAITLRSPTAPVAHALTLPGAQGAAGDLLLHSATPGTLEWTRTLRADLNFAGYKAIAMACDNGAVFPTSPAPTEGQWFLFEPGSRRVLYQRINSIWVPGSLFGAATITVAKTGNDTTGNGEAGAPYLTLQKAFDELPINIGGNVQINVGAGVYTENPVLRGKRFSGDFGIVIQGHATYTGSPETITGHDGGTVGVAATAPPQALATITRSSGTWTVDAYKGMIVNIAGTVPSTMNVNRVIKSNTTTTITLCGAKLTRVVDAADVITIYPQSSVGGTEDTRIAGNLINGLGQDGVVYNDIRIQPVSGTAFTGGGESRLVRCVLLDLAPVVVSGGSSATFADCFMRATGANVSVVSMTGARIFMSATGCYLLNNGTASTRGLRMSGFVNALIGNGTVIENGAIGGLFVADGAMLNVNSTSATPGLFLENCTVPVSAAADGFYSLFNDTPGALSVVGGGAITEQGFTQPVGFRQTTRHIPVAAPVAPLAGHVWNDLTQATLYEFTNAIRQSLDGAIFTQTANVTVDSAVVTTTETSLVGAGNGTNTLPASWWRSGKSIRVSAAGVISTQAVPGTLRIKIKKGATILLDTLAQAPTGAMANHLWRITAVITGRSTTTVTGQSFFEYTPAVIGAPQFWEMTNSVAGVAAPLTLVTIATTSEAITISAQWSAASLTDTITLTNLTLESLN